MSCSVTGFSFLLHPSEVGRRSFSAASDVSALRTLCFKIPPYEIRREREKRRVHTEKELHQRPIRRAGVRVSERDDRRRQLAQAELLHRRGESVCRVEGARVDLAREFAVGELLGGEDAGGPELFARGEGGGVEEVVVAVVGVHAAGGY